jgi:CubicO group peptidase (beta-lactamase class C family)
MKNFLLSILFFSFAILQSQNTYFPPLSDANWQTTDPKTLSWCTDSIPAFYDFLDKNNTKAFVVLKDGKIVMEKYFDTFTRDSIWYWASAGKTLVGFLAGVAQQNKLISIHEKVSTYLGKGWTSAPIDKEDMITVKNQLTMTSGLDETVPDDNCILPSCLKYKADAGTRWAYYNASYRLVQDVIEKASSKTISQYTTQTLTAKTGITGAFVNYIYYSKPLTAARFGLLMLNKGIWNKDSILKDPMYHDQMINTSQQYNNSYGFLTWLNGKSSYMLPQVRIIYPGTLVANAPADMYAALGKNDQKIYMIPSKNMVVVRMGDASSTSLFALSNFDDQLWARFNNILKCNTSPTESLKVDKPMIYPNPVSDILNLDLPFSNGLFDVKVINIEGKVLITKENIDNKSALDLSDLNAGMYIVQAIGSNGIFSFKVVKN